MNMLKCLHCDKIYKYESERKRHQKSHFPQFECKTCCKKFSFLSALRRHEKQHERVGCVQCTDCGGNFRDETLLKRHMKYAHKGTYACAECDATFNSELALGIHSKIHKPEAERRYRCSYDDCNKSFNFPHHLKHHELTHTNCKQYFCNECGKGFIQSHHLKTHLKTYHPSLWFMCAVQSNKKLSRNKDLTKHVKILGLLSDTKIDSGISSDSNSASDLPEQNEIDTDIEVLCAECGEFILKSQYVKHCEVECTFHVNPKIMNTNLNEDCFNLKNDISKINIFKINEETRSCCREKGENISAQPSCRTSNVKYVSETCNRRKNCPTEFGTRNVTETCNMPEIEYRSNGIIKIKETFDHDIVAATKPQEGTVDVKHTKSVPYNSCKAVLGNCIASEDGTVGDGCLCANMMIDDQQMSAQEIEEITPNPNNDWFV